jgi:hypothetical protein
VGLADHLEASWRDAAHLKPYRVNPRLAVARAHLARAGLR